MQELEDLVYDLSVNLDTVKDTQAYMKAISEHHNQRTCRVMSHRVVSCRVFTSPSFIRTNPCAAVPRAVITSTHNHIMWWTCAEAVVLTAVALTQISFLRRTLEVRRIL